MEYNKLIEINKNILNKAMVEVEKGRVIGKYDCEDMEAMSMAINNIKDLMKIKRYEEGNIEYPKEEKTIAMATPMKIDAKTETTEFEALIYKISEKKPDHEGMYAITTILAETMEDLRILHPKFYNMTMVKLKELLD